MRKYISAEKILWICLLLFFVSSLSACGTEMYETPIYGFSDETNLFGWLLIYPIAWIMHTIGSFFGNSFGIGLIFTTLIVRTCAWPIYARTNDMSIKMQVAQPEMNRVQQKYAGRTDEQSKQRQQMEMMAIYKKYNINMFGCLMPLIQMPIFMAMYTVVKRITVEGGSLTLDNYNLFGIFDLTQNATTGDLPSMIFGWGCAAIVGASMYLLQVIAAKKPSYAKNIPSNGNSQAEAMQKQMKIMNIVMIGMMVMVATSDNGLALYWVVGNIFSLGQTIVNRKLNEKKYNKLKEIV